MIITTAGKTDATAWPSRPILTDLQQCIKDCLHLATFAHAALSHTGSELARLQRLIEVQVQKELDAWKALMGSEKPSETCNQASGI